MMTNTSRCRAPRAPRITWDQYKAAADRLAVGARRLGDEALMAAYDAQELPMAARARDWWELPAPQRGAAI